METRGPQINHLSFADDVIIFASSDRLSLHLIMKTMSTYETTSGQLINKDKSHFMDPENSPVHIILLIKEITGFIQKGSPITYLGCPFYIGRQRIIYYSDRLQRCAVKYGGKQSSVPRVKFLILKDITNMFQSAFPYLHWPNSCERLLKIVESCWLEVQVKEVKWIRPLGNIFKLNKDGSALGNPDQIRGGGIHRDSKGDMVYAFIIPLGSGTNNQAETLAAAHGIQWCMAFSKNQTFLEPATTTHFSFYQHHQSAGIFSV
ncbi:hypothetical protein MTR67_006954 [Solanum verrucosum]|uniref:Reverse transcriptase domain-containing protein n=1 Tax=Solanum verrucosum TaxID=315347 RepID=A0AAF0TCM9_SOLVR|nr:hypothetical protein MTR67_006954 [Solanum verrucosum]